VARATKFFVEGREKRSRLMVRSRERQRYHTFAGSHAGGPILPMNTISTAAYAAVAPKVSTLLGLAITASTTENKRVETKIALSLIIGDRM
jgi:hypothetical protein